MKSIHFALGLGVGTEHLATADREFILAEALAQISQLQPTQ